MKKIIERVANVTLKEADDITKEIIEPYPNTYSFTKALGEYLLMAERDNLPICILRPAIVTAGLYEPIPGWIDALLGPAGLFLATGSGFLRVMKGSSDIIADFVPVDIVCNSILVAAWRNVKLAKESPETFPSKVPIYHIATSTANPITWLWPRYIVSQYFVRYKPKRSLGHPFAFFCNNDIGFTVCKYLFHYVPALAVDAMRILQGKKTFLFKAATRLDKIVQQLQHFTTNNWFFSNRTTEEMIDDLNESDRKLYLIDVRGMDWDYYFITFCHGMRIFLLKDEIPAPSKPSEKLQQQQQQQQPQPQQKGFLASIMDYMRSWLLIISLGCFVYFFRQNFWLLRLRAKQIRQMIFKKTQKLLTSNA